MELIKKIDHIGIAVRNLDEANSIYQKLLGVAPYKIESVASEKVLTSFFKTGESKIELLEAQSQDSAIAQFIERKGEGIHHIAFEVEDIHQEIKRLKAEGFQILNEEPKRGADHKLICFVHPKSCNGVLIELCQSINE